MPALLVHGVPDTPRVWHRVLARLSRTDVEAVALPGFGGAPRPTGFEPDKDRYAQWLVERVLSFGEPVDLVGHDWGGMLALRAASLAPAWVRSLVFGGSPLDPSYVWHDTARLWQTPGVGEQVMDALGEDALCAALAEAGVPEDDAASAAARMDDATKACILGLYRSAEDVGAEWGPDLGAIRAPALALWGEDDPFASAALGARMAERLGAPCVAWAGCGHWWPLERAQETAAELEAFWAQRP